MVLVDNVVTAAKGREGPSFQVTEGLEIHPSREDYVTVCWQRGDRAGTEMSPAVFPLLKCQTSLFTRRVHVSINRAKSVARDSPKKTH